MSLTVWVASRPKKFLRSSISATMRERQPFSLQSSTTRATSFFSFLTITRSYPQTQKTQSTATRLSTGLSETRTTKSSSCSWPMAKKDVCRQISWDRLPSSSRLSPKTLRCWKSYSLTSNCRHSPSETTSVKIVCLSVRATVTRLSSTGLWAPMISSRHVAPKTTRAGQLSISCAWRAKTLSWTRSTHAQTPQTTTAIYPYSTVWSLMICQCSKSSSKKAKSTLRCATTSTRQCSTWLVATTRLNLSNLWLVEMCLSLRC